MRRLRAGALAILVTAAAVHAATPNREDFAGGLAALVERDFRVAEARFRAVLASDPDSYEAHNNLAVALAEQGRDEEAQSELQTALRIRADYDRARQNLAAVYVRLAAKQLLLAAQQAAGARRQALGARARELLIAGPNLPPAELLSRADQLAGVATPGVVSPPSAPAAAPASTMTVAPTGLATPPPMPSATPAGVARALFIEPVGAQALVLDPVQRRASLYRRTNDTLEKVGSWSVSWRGVVASTGLRAVSRRTDWSVRLLEPQTQKASNWSIEAATKATKTADAAVLAAADFRAATAQLTPGRDMVIVAPNAFEPSLDAPGSQQLHDRLEAWRAAWAGRDLAAYDRLYAPNFVDARQRARADWRARKQAVFEHSGEISVQLHDVALSIAGDEAVASFEQEYRSALERSRARKFLQWRRIDGEWLIVAERTTDGSRRSATDE